MRILCLTFWLTANFSKWRHQFNNLISNVWGFQFLHVFVNAYYYLGFPGGASGKEPTCHAGDVREVGLILGSGRSPGGGHGIPLQYSCLENPMDRGAWQATVHRVAKSQTWLKWLSMHACITIIFLIIDILLSISSLSFWLYLNFPNG